MGQNRVIIIDSVDSLNKAGANALLKSLEEPPANCYFLLICHQRANLLPTLLSRVVQLPISNLSKSECLTVARNLLPASDDLELLTALSHNSPGVMQNYAALPNWRHLLGVVLECKVSATSIQAIEAAISEPEAALSLLLLWQAAIQGTIKARVGVLSELPADLTSWANKLSPNSLLALEASIAEHIYALGAYKMDPRATLFTVLYKAAELMLA